MKYLIVMFVLVLSFQKSFAYTDGVTGSLRCINSGLGVAGNDMGPWFGMADLRLDYALRVSDARPVYDKLVINSLTGVMNLNFESESFTELLNDYNEGTISMMFNNSEAVMMGNLRAPKYTAEKYYYYKNLLPKFTNYEVYESFLVISKDLKKAYFRFEIEQNGATVSMSCHKI